jgi:glutamate 5-kinase
MRVVVKVGTSTVHAGDTALADLADQIVALVGSGHAVALFSSGAVHAGREAFGPSLDAQAAAALGQPLVFEAWRRAFANVGLVAGQVLVDDRDLEPGGGAAPVVEALWRAGAVPVLNGNDAIDAGRAPVSDNDAMAAQLALHLQADRLVLLTDQDGICTADPRLDPSAKPIRRISTGDLAALVPAMSQAAAGPQGRGGMASKARAALKAARGGVRATIAHGREPRVVARVIGGEGVGTTVDSLTMHPAARPSPVRRGVREAVAYGAD